MLRFLNKKERTMKTSPTPNPDRIYAAVAKILERRHGVRINYTINKKEKAS
jgi:hypothetical protein